MALLYVDDDETICWLMIREWQKAFPKIPLYVARSPADAIARAEECGEELLAAVVDWRLAGTTAENLIRELRQRWPELSVIVTSAALESRQVRTARRAGADDYLVKNLSMPAFVMELIALINAVVERRSGDKSR